MYKGCRQNIPLSSQLGERGMTLVEVVVVMALMILIMAAATASIKAMGKSSDVNKLSNDLTRIVYGINEYQLISKKISPSGEDWWPGELNDFVDAGLQSTYKYRCDNLTGNIVVITTFGTYNFDPTPKLIDQNLCTGSSSWNADKTVSCCPVVTSTQSCN
jgi:type II secretory pathway pseudopilin PulG